MQAEKQSALDAHQEGNHSIAHYMAKIAVERSTYAVLARKFSRGVWGYRSSTAKMANLYRQMLNTGKTVAIYR